MFSGNEAQQGKLRTMCECVFICVLVSRNKSAHVEARLLLESRVFLHICCQVSMSIFGARAG